VTTADELELEYEKHHPGHGNHHHREPDEPVAHR